MWNRWLPSQGANIPSKSTCNLLNTQLPVHFLPIHTYISELLHCAHMHFTHTSCLLCWWGAVCMRSGEHSELSRQAADAALVSSYCSAVPRMWVSLLNRDVRGEWMAVTPNRRHFVFGLFIHEQRSWRQDSNLQVRQQENEWMKGESGMFVLLFWMAAQWAWMEKSYSSIMFEQNPCSLEKWVTPSDKKLWWFCVCIQELVICEKTLEAGCVRVIVMFNLRVH